MKYLRQYIRQLLEEDAQHRKAFGDDLAKIQGYKTADSPGWNPNYAERRIHGRTLKKLFHKHADHDFLSSLTTIHWGSSSGIADLLRSWVYEKAGRDELSCNAYKEGENKIGAGIGGGTIGLVVDGHITLLANDMDDIVSGFGLAIKNKWPDRTKSSGANKGVGIRAANFGGIK